VKGTFGQRKAAYRGSVCDDTRISRAACAQRFVARGSPSFEEADPLVKERGFSVEVLKWWAAKA